MLIIIVGLICDKILQNFAFLNHIIKTLLFIRIDIFTLVYALLNFKEVQIYIKVKYLNLENKLKIK